MTSLHSIIGVNGYVSDSALLAIEASAAMLVPIVGRNHPLHKKICVMSRRDTIDFIGLIAETCD